MNANRRSFLKTLFVGAAAVAIARVMPRVVEKPRAPASALLVSPWFQTTRVVSHCSPAYLEAVDRLMAGTDGTAFIRAFTG